MGVNPRAIPICARARRGARWARGWVLLAWIVCLTPARAGVVRSEHTAVELVAGVAAVAPGQPFWVALRMQMDPHWHTYTKNYGDAGAPTNVEWQLPPGWTAGPIQWPTPKRIPTGSSIMSYGYEGEVLLAMQLTPPANLPLGENVTLRAKADWLECEDICMTGAADLSLTLPVAATAVPDATWQAAIAATLANLPKPPTTFTVSAWRQGDNIFLALEPGPGAAPDPQDVYFYSGDNQIRPASPQTWRKAGPGWVLTMTRAGTAPPDAQTLQGVLTTAGSWTAGGQVPAVAIAAPLGSAPPAAFAGAVAAAPSAPPADALGLVAALGLGFLGGLILNVMPCVFPVLGLKIMGFVQQAGHDRRHVAAHGLTFTAGVVASMWALVGALLWLRHQGDEIGWGFQLQEPGFVLALTIVLLVFGLSLSGVFEIGLSATGVGGALTARGGYPGSFAQGVLAVVVATPCTAPFLGPALGAAFTLPPVQAWLAFTAIALGLAVPYLFLSFFPGMVKWLPRPGAWMETFKQGLAFLLYGAAGYLLFVLAGQVPDEQFRNILLGLVVVAMAAWLYGRYATLAAGVARRRFGQVGGLLLLSAGAAMAYWPVPDLGWEPWSPERVAELQAEGRPIYVDFTARWCATCQSNKLAVFSSEKVLDAFRRDRVALLKGDWTNKDAAITAELTKYGPPAVPLNLLYLPGRPAPEVLPKLLTPGLVLEALESAPAAAPCGARFSLGRKRASAFEIFTSPAASWVVSPQPLRRAALSLLQDLRAHRATRATAPPPRAPATTRKGCARSAPA